MSGMSNPAFWSAVAPSFRRILRTVRNTIVRRATERALSALDARALNDRALNDLAMSRGDILYLSRLAARALEEDAGDQPDCGMPQGDVFGLPCSCFAAAA